MDYYFAWLIPVAPLVAAVLCAVMAATGAGARFAHLPVWCGLSVSAVASLVLLQQIDVAQAVTVPGGYQWLDVGSMRVSLALQLDAISLVQISVVTCVSALVAFYSRGYMHGDPGYARYFAVFSAFVASMAMLVLTNNLLVLFGCWEGVGICSYLLIGYWYKRPAAAKAATKAFLVNRIADCGFLLGILLIWVLVGDVYGSDAGIVSRLDYTSIFAAMDEAAARHPHVLALVGGLLLVAAIGKSAQFPLHVWLPDAMEGPTPVSALIHAATMVTAGVFLLCRMSPLLVHVPGVLVVAGWIGGVTALLAASAALFQHDLKRVLAYSTISQLGYMFMAIGCGARTDLMNAAVMAALFHVATHAFFKALLFLGAGNVMHAMGDCVDMRQFGGLRRILPATHWLFMVGAAALAGVPLASGFWSKDGILELLTQMAQHERHGIQFSMLLAIGYATALLTAVYVFRALLRTFYGPLVLPASAGSHAHEMPMGMLWPMVVLACGSLFLGLALAPTDALAGYFSRSAVASVAHGVSHGLVVPVVSALLCATGLAVAWASVGGSAGGFAFGGFLRPVARTTEAGFFLDAFYAACVVRPLCRAAGMLASFDVHVVDGIWRRVACVPPVLGRAYRYVQSGLVSSYAGWMTLGLVVLLLVVLFVQRP